MGFWSADGNWTVLSYPTGDNATATFPNVATDVTVDLVGGPDPSPFTVKELFFTLTPDIYTLTNGTITGSTTDGLLITLTASTSGAHIISSALDINALGLTVNNLSSADFTIDGTIGESAAALLTKQGSGALVLGGTNTYSDGTTIEAGTIRVSEDANLGDTGGVLTFEGSASTLNATDTFEMTRDVLLGTAFGDAEPIIDVNATKEFTISGVISNVNDDALSTFTKVGDGTLILEGDNTFVRQVNLDAGKIILAEDPSALGVLSPLSLTAAGTEFEIAMGAGEKTIGSLEGVTGSQISLKAATTLRVTQAAPLEFAGVISGTGTVIKDGTATLTLSDANDYNGGTTIVDGRLTLNSTGTLESADDNSFLEILNDGEFAIEGSKSIPTLSGDTDSSILLGAGNALTINQFFDETFSGVISETSTSNIIKNESGVLTLENTNTYTGTTTINNGRISLSGASSTLGDVSDLTINAPGEFEIETDAGNKGIGFLAGDGNVFLNNNDLLIDQGSTSSTFSGVISGEGGVAKEGTGALTLDGPNVYEGGSVIDEGDITLTASGTLGSEDSPLTINGSSSLTMAVGAGPKSVGTLNGDSGTDIFLSSTVLTINQAVDGTYSGDITASLGGGITKSGPAKLTLDGIGTYTLPASVITVEEGTLQGDTDSLAADILNDAILIFDQGSDGTYSNDISGTGELIKEGAGKLTFTGINTYSGGTTVSDGDLQGNTANLQGVIDLAAGSTLIFDQAVDGTYLNPGEVAIKGDGAVSKIGVGKLTFATGLENTYTGGTTVSFGELQGDTDSLQGDIATAASTSVIFNQTAADGTYAGVMSGGGSLEKLGTESLTLTGINTYTGGTLVSAGILELTAENIVGDIENNAEVIFDQIINDTFSGDIIGSGILTKEGTGVLTLSGDNSYSGGTTVAAGTLRGDTASLQGDIVNNTAVIFDQGFDGAYSGDMTGIGKLTKNGLGNITFSGTNTYTGITDINAGTLTNNGTLSPTVITVHTGSTLTGSGTFGMTKVQGGVVAGTGTYNGLTLNTGVVSPGGPSVIGTINVIGDYVQNAGSFLEIDIEGTNSDQVIATGSGTVATGAALKVNALPSIISPGNTYDVLIAPDGINQLWDLLIFPPGFDFEAMLVDNDTIARLLVLKRIPFPGKIIDPGNPSAVNNYLSCLDIPPDSDLANVVEAMQILNSAQLNEALNLLHPALFAAFELVNLDNNSLITSAFGEQVRHLADFKRQSNCLGDTIFTSTSSLAHYVIEQKIALPSCTLVGSS